MASSNNEGPFIKITTVFNIYCFTASGIKHRDKEACPT
jgi:hypothetical protein